MKKELHIWLGENYPDKSKLLITLEATERALQNNCDRVDTTQPHFCSTAWIVRGYKVFVHMLGIEVVEMKLGYIKGSSKEIRVCHNLEKMLLANRFGSATLSYKNNEECTGMKNEIHNQVGNTQINLACI